MNFILKTEPIYLFHYSLYYLFMSFNEEYSKIFDVVRSDIERINMLKGIDVPKPLEVKLSEILNAPSKHIRPLLSFLYLKACSGEITETQLKYQTAIELVHNASLIHDDIIDESLLRRNVETLNSKFDNHLAVIAGDYLLARALKSVIEIGQIELVELFRETLETMTKGEIGQYFDKYNIPVIGEYIKKSEQKTAKLFQAAITGAMILNNQNETLLEKDDFSKVKDFAKNFGIAFQIRDDLINCKTTKSDIKEGVYTAPVIFSGGIEITDCGLEKTVDLLNNYLNAAKEALSNLPENIYKQYLSELIDLFRHE